jgi:O-antigen/teichoic acid export membrane protein
VLSFMVLARGFSKSEFGQWILYLSLLTFFDMIKSGMVQSAFIKYASGARGGGGLKLEGSSWVLNFIVTLFFSVISLVTYWLGVFEAEGLVLFLVVYPLYSFAAMPFHYFLWSGQIKLDFKQVAVGRIVNVFLFLLATLSTFYFNVGVRELVLLHLFVFVISSFLALLSKKTGIRSVLKADISTLKIYWNYGRYHSLAFLGSNLLKSSDTFIIGGILGPVYIAIYSIPLRLVEIIELPLKASVSVAFPVFSAHDNEGDLTSLKKSLEKYIGVLTLLYVPFMTLLFLSSDYLVYVIGGEKYAETGNIFRLFLIYGLFLPFDRLTGVVLDAMGYPRLNFIKVVLMATVNILGNVIVLYWFRSLKMVAIVTIANVLTGTLIGFFITRNKLGISLKSIFLLGAKTIIKSINQIKTAKL